MVIQWTTSSVDDLKNFKNYSKSSNINLYISKLVRYTDNLIDQPKLGKIYLYTKGYIVRQLIYQKHKIFYYVDEDTIHILSVVHHKQNPQDKINFIKKYVK